MAKSEPIKLRIIAFQDGDAWTAQCIEYDIAAQAPNLQTLVNRMDDTIKAELKFTLEKHGEAFKGIGAAPDYFETVFCSVPDTSLNSEMDFRIAA